VRAHSREGQTALARTFRDGHVPHALSMVAMSWASVVPSPVMSSVMSLSAAPHAMSQQSGLMAHTRVQQPASTPASVHASCA